MLKSLRRPEGDYRALFALMIPIILQNLASSSLGLCDTLMVGILGQNELGGLNQANTIFFVFQLFTFGIMSGGSVLIGQYWGKKDIGAINRVMGMSFYLAFGVSMVAATAVFLFPSEIMALTTNDPALIDCAARYSRIVAYSFVLNSLSMVYISAQRSAENSSLGMIVLITSMATNIFLNWVLIFGNLGAPVMGLEGAATATFISRVIEFLMVVVYMFFIDKRIPIMPKKMLKPGKAIAQDYIKYATPVVINETLWSAAYSMYAVVYGHMQGASDIIAAYSVTGSIERIMLVLCNGVGTAAAVIISKQIGEGRKKIEVLETGRWLLKLSVITGLITAVLPIITERFLLDGFIYEVFNISGNAMGIGHMMMLVTVVRVIVKTYNYMIIVGILRGGGNVKTAAVLDVLFMYIWSVPGCFIAALVFDAPIEVVYIFALSEDIIKAVVGGWLVHRGEWIHDVTRNDI
ncbi:MAG: MATE family efflux transporter [Oscillospiraceae bacterium]|nr:MATE family efflux transporter [Oscillospiraceae bacterium]